MKSKTLADSEISLEIVQKLVSQLENRDPRTLPQLPGRIILPGGEEVLAKSYSGEVYYHIVRSGNGWQCGCPAGQHHKPCKHVRTLESYLSGTQARSAELLREEPKETQAQAYQRRKRAAIAAARAGQIAPVDSIMDTSRFAPAEA